MNRKIELLAPAGNIESFKAAVNAGADAVYMGLGKHNARVMAKNFTLEDYIECLNYAHVRGVKVYLTLNTLVEDDEIKEVMQVLIKLYSHGLDAVILQDLGLANIIRKVIPELHMHASTQMSVYSLEQVKYLEKLGFKRVVLARELTIDEIRYITNNTSIEIEAFVHGALCVSVSGQCFLSQSIGNRSANRGACAQPCRMRYSLANSKEILEKNKHLLSKKDIFGLDILKEILQANFISLKIEGRNKSAEYVALVTSMYRKYIDKYINGQDLKVDLMDEKKALQIFNRSGKSYGYLKGVEYRKSITRVTPKNTGIYLGKVIAKKGKFAKIEIEENIDMHDGVEIYSKNGQIASTIVTCIKDNNGRIINSSQERGNVVYIGDFNNSNFNIGDEVYKTSNNRLNQEVAKKYIKSETRKREMVLNVNIKKNSPIILSTIVNGEMYIFNTNAIPEEAINKEITLDEINENFSKTQNSGIKFIKTIGYVQKGLFIRVSTLNDIRRKFIQKVEEKYHIIRDVEQINKKLEFQLNIKRTLNVRNIMTHEIMSLYRYNKELKYDEIYLHKYNKRLQTIYFQITDYIINREDILKKYNKYDIGIIIPNVNFEKSHKLIIDNLNQIVSDGVKYVVLGSFRYIDLLLKLKETYKFKLIADYSLNICNSYAAKFIKDEGFDIVVPCYDASDSQIEKISQIIDIELIDNYQEVMTSRYCIIGAFVENRKENQKCSLPCIKDNYYLIDSHNEKYNILCNNIDCIMKILKSKKLKETFNYNVRKNEI